jgi:outer membrane protein assembly factor BamA
MERYYSTKHCVLNVSNIHGSSISARHVANSICFTVFFSFCDTSVKDQAGQSLKTAITHSFVRDRRDNATLPTRGHYIALHHELAGVGTKSDSSFFKKEVAAQIHQRLLEPVVAENGKAVPPLVLSGGFRAGLIASLDKKEPHISDRFILGGPTSIRGFKLGGIGPRDGGTYKIVLGTMTICACFGLLTVL